MYHASIQCMLQKQAGYIVNFQQYKPVWIDLSVFLLMLLLILCLWLSQTGKKCFASQRLFLKNVPLGLILYFISLPEI